jgi:hypothetical protein
VLAYLGRYTHRVALSNHRIADVGNGQVTFRWKDYRGKGRQKARVMTLAADEFMRRFLLHTLPPGFQRIRYFGFLANRFRKEKLELCRRLLTIVTVLLTALLPQPTSCQVPEGPSFRFCPRCRTGILIRTAIVAPYLWPQPPPDTS